MNQEHQQIVVSAAEKLNKMAGIVGASTIPFHPALNEDEVNDILNEAQAFGLTAERTDFLNDHEGQDFTNITFELANRQGAHMLDALRGASPV